jgi:hypothetical protein
VRPGLEGEGPAADGALREGVVGTDQPGGQDADAEVGGKEDVGLAQEKLQAIGPVGA